MNTYFDPQTLSLTIDYSLDEYKNAMNPDASLGIFMWETLGDRRKTLRFRHEHSHFTSFLGSGLSELYGIVSDYKLVFLFSILHRAITSNSKNVTEVPLIFSSDLDSVPIRQEILNGWKQINQLSALLFGFGGKLNLAEISSLTPQNKVWATYYDSVFDPIIQRYFRLMEGIENCGQTGTAEVLPSVSLHGRSKMLSARSVWEAFAITIELFNTHFRGMRTSLNDNRPPRFSNPGPHYTIAIELALEALGKKSKYPINDFLNGEAPIDDYYLVAVTSFAAMQVPVMQHLVGEVAILGEFEKLSPAHRFVAIVDAMKKGDIQPLPSNISNRSNLNEPRDDLLEWFGACHTHLGHPEVMGFYEFVHEQLRTNEQLQNMSPNNQSLIEMAWAARGNFYTAPNEFVLDGGLFAEHYPCQARYIRTSDHKLVVFGNPDEFQLRYIREHAIPVLEAAVFANSWDSNWKKYPEQDSAEFGSNIAATYALLTHEFQYAEDPSELVVPEIATRIS